jgi:hypothetical protein
VYDEVHVQAVSARGRDKLLETVMDTPSPKARLAFENTVSLHKPEGIGVDGQHPTPH